MRNDSDMFSFDDIDERARAVFRSLVDTYIESGAPVGSRTLSRALPMTLSPASVRNVMSDLEEAGLLYSPHTSAGRVPTEAGLRFFVDTLMDRSALSGGEREEITRQIEGSGDGRSEDVLRQASNLLSGLSHCAAVVVAPKSNIRVKHIEFIHLAAERALVVLVGEDGTVENRVVELPKGFPVSALVRISNYLNTRYQGLTLKQVQARVQDELNRLKKELDEVSARVVEAGLAVWGGNEGAAERHTLIVRGQANLIDEVNAADDLERIRSLFADLEAKQELIDLLSVAEVGEGVQIFIGSENKLFSLSGSSLVLAPYSDQQANVVGVLGVIGPTRINYARIVPMVDYTAQVVGRLLA